MADTAPEFDQQDISNANGPVDTVVDGSDTRLMVDAKTNQLPGDTPGCPTLSNKLVYELDETTINLTTVFQDVFSYGGSGKVVGFMADVENTNTVFKISVDSNVIWEGEILALGTMTGNKEFSIGGLYTSDDFKKLVLVPGCPIKYGTIFKVEAKSATSKDLFRHMACLTKET